MDARNFLSTTYRHVHVFLSAVFLAPTVLFAFRLNPLPGVAVLIGCAGALFVSIRAMPRGADGILDRRLDVRTLAMCSLAAVVLCVLGGQGHFLFANYDWLVRDAVLADLTQQNFPASYTYQGAAFLLRAPLGMYMLPAAIGRVFGLTAAHLALLAQNAAILAALLTLLCAIAPRRKFAFVLVFLFFGGVEILARPDVVVSAAAALATDPAKLLAIHPHLGAWNPLFQYTHHIAQIFWVPHHAFPGWWLALLVLLHVRGAVDRTALVIAPAFLIFWSPLAVMGAVPFILYLVLRPGLTQLFVPRPLLAVAFGCCFLPVAAYLGIDTGTVLQRWLVGRENFWPIYLLFIAIEIPQVAIVALCRHRLDRDARILSVLAFVLLLALPLYQFGTNNDFAMRASIVPLALLACVFAGIVAELTWSKDAKVLAPAALIVALACIGPLLEIRRAFALERFAISDCNLITIWNYLEPDLWLSNYFANAASAPKWLLRREAAAIPASIDPRRCWPDHPFRDIPISHWRDSQSW